MQLPLSSILISPLELEVDGKTVAGVITEAENIFLFSIYNVSKHVVYRFIIKKIERLV